VSNTDFGILLGLAYQRFVFELNEHMSAKGFRDTRPTFGYVLRALADQRRTTAQLAARLGVTSQGMAKIVAEMQAAGIVSFHADPGDARAKLLDLSPRGRRMLKTAREFHRDFERRLGDQAPLIRAALTTLVERDGLAPGLDRPLRLPG
jgi:DNA-binding MarR family transcriptional regulator